MKNTTVAAIFIAAMAFELSLKGLVMSVRKLVSVNLTAPKIMVAVNLLGLMYAPLFVVSNFGDDGNCQHNALLFKLNMHAFFICFDLFLLYKTWVVAQKRKSVAILGGLLLMHRTSWACVDCLRSFAFTDDSTGKCLYSQDQLAAVGFLLGDLFVDVFCSATTIYSANKDVDQTSTKMQRLYAVLIADNVIRTVLTLTSNMFLLWFGLYGPLKTDASATSNATLLILPCLTYYTYALALNLEYFWMAVRSNLMRSKYV
ncbi:hypothetical protein CcCBS67573_g09547 [Chytriomyces confervae]|uniref:Uncharacterized protein n=1 Tax=Chytriomyces confervae TaxID=246404 RepID=A0A507DUT9_9FUNG|nr:hypothetical protein CcCBS67573_g09547 [Chytriomyces confervae]